MELAASGNTVYFLNPLSPSLPGAGTLNVNKIEEGLFEISCSRWIPSFLRFKFPRLFHAFMRSAIRYILKKIDRKIDIVWCFNAHHYEDLKVFGAELSIFHPVDLYVEDEMPVTRGADLLLGTTDDILLKFEKQGVPCYKVRHGVAASFLKYCDGYLKEDARDYNGKEYSIQVGYVGNLLKKHTDRQSFQKFIIQNPHVTFHLWGPYEVADSNISIRGETISPDVISFIEFLGSSDNVRLYGAKTPNEIAFGFRNLDAFFMCYNLEEAVNKGADSHKILEYLSTGKVCISHHISGYQNKPGLVEMLASEDNEDLPSLFNRVISNLQDYNTEELRRSRIEFAVSHSYAVQLDAIDEMIGDHKLLV